MRLIELGSLLANILASVLLISTNKTLLSTQGFLWSCTLSGLHFAFTAVCSVLVAVWNGESTDRQKAITTIPPVILLLFTALCIFSIAGSQLSLKLNSVGFFQISKLGQIGLTCALERIILKKRFSNTTVFSIFIVISGIFVTSMGSVVTNSAVGLYVAILAVFAASAQQLSLSVLQTRYSLTSNNLIAQTFYIQAIVLLVAGPFVDLFLVGSFPTSWIVQAQLQNYIYLVLSCTSAIFVNYSQVICIKQLSPTGFQVLGNAKTFCILLIGYLFFDASVSVQTLLGQGLAVAGMCLYGFSARKEPKSDARMSDAMPSHAQASTFRV
jgi:solute carrier family 35 protein E3